MSSGTYTHLPQGEDIGPEGRSYSMTEEIMEYGGRQVLFLQVVATDISFCDRNYAPYLVNASVQGYVVRWKYGRNKEGAELSEIEPVTDPEDRRAMAGFLRETQNIPTIIFV